MALNMLTGLLMLVVWLIVGAAILDEPHTKYMHTLLGWTAVNIIVLFCCLILRVAFLMLERLPVYPKLCGLSAMAPCLGEEHAAMYV